MSSNRGATRSELVGVTWEIAAAVQTGAELVVGGGGRYGGAWFGPRTSAAQQGLAGLLSWRGGEVVDHAQLRRFI